jgi:hypothetical protein
MSQLASAAVNMVYTSDRRLFTACLLQERKSALRLFAANSTPAMIDGLHVGVELKNA